jgi:hypothetical protein
MAAIKKVGHLKYCLQYGFVKLHPNASKSFKSRYFEENTYIDIYFKEVDECLVYKAFIENSLRFSRSSQLFHKLFSSSSDIDFDSEEAKQVKEKCESAVLMFKHDLKELIKANDQPKVYQTLGDYIDQHHNGSQSDFARSRKTKDGKPVDRKQVNQWVKKGFIVADNKLYSERRDID